MFLLTCTLLIFFKSIGYQDTPFENNVEDIVEIYLKNGDSCLDTTSKISKKKYSTKITLLCDITEAEVKNA